MKKGFTLIEAVISMAIIAVSVASSLVIMGKLASVTATKGNIMSLLTASAVAQYTVDEVRDIPFPPINTIEKLDYAGTSSENYEIDSDYKFSRRITDHNGSTISTTDYGNNGDAISSDQNLLKVAVTIYKNDKPLMTTYTYKVRNGTF